MESALFCTDMAKAILWIVVIIILAAGGYYVYQNMMGTSSTAQTGQNATSTPQDVVQAQDVTVGTGAEATPGSMVEVLYVGRLQDGTVFDSSEAHNNEPLRFQLGTEGLIAGFQIGVNGMKVGGERVLAVPPALGYGAQDIKDSAGKVIIPANSTLIFNVQLKKVEAAPATTTQ